MNSQVRRSRSIHWIVFAIIVAGGWLLVALVGLDPRIETLNALILGTMFGQATLAAVLTALGPGPFVWRLPACLAWLVSLELAVVINVWRSRAPDPPLILAATLGQWLLAQPLVWAMVWRRSLGIRLESDEPGRSAAEFQFGIRQLMILTAMIAVLLGAGRALAPAIKSALDGGSWREAPIFAFVVTTNMVLTLPVGLGILLPQRASLACGLG